MYVSEACSPAKKQILRGCTGLASACQKDSSTMGTNRHRRRRRLYCFSIIRSHSSSTWTFQDCMFGFIERLMMILTCIVSEVFCLNRFVIPKQVASTITNAARMAPLDASRVPQMKACMFFYVVPRACSRCPITQSFKSMNTVRCCIRLVCGLCLL